MYFGVVTDLEALVFLHNNLFWKKEEKLDSWALKQLAEALKFTQIAWHTFLRTPTMASG